MSSSSAVCAATTDIRKGSRGSGGRAHSGPNQRAEPDTHTPTVGQTLYTYHHNGPNLIHIPPQWAKPYTHSPTVGRTLYTYSHSDPNLIHIPPQWAKPYTHTPTVGRTLYTYPHSGPNLIIIPPQWTEHIHIPPQCDKQKGGICCSLVPLCHPLPPFRKE